MAVRPIGFRTDGSQFEMVCDHCGYTGWEDADGNANYRFPLGSAGEKDFRFLQIECPTCHAVSTHPVSGGCDSVNIQKMFAFLYNHDPDQPATNPVEALPYIRTYCAQMGEGLRFALDGWSPQQEQSI